MCNEPDLKPSFGVLNDPISLWTRSGKSRNRGSFRIFKSYPLKYKKYDSSTNVTVALNTFKADVDQSLSNPSALYSQGLLTYSSPPDYRISLKSCSSSYNYLGEGEVVCSNGLEIDDIPKGIFRIKSAHLGNKWARSEESMQEQMSPSSLGALAWRLSSTRNHSSPCLQVSYGLDGLCSGIW